MILPTRSEGEIIPEGWSVTDTGKSIYIRFQDRLPDGRIRRFEHKFTDRDWTVEIEPTPTEPK